MDDFEKMIRLFKRQKLLLKLINELEEKGIKSRRAIVKSLFLLRQEYFIDNYIKFYSFYPYRQGPFSQQCFSDLRKLRKEQILDDNETSLTSKGNRLLKEFDINFDGQINHLLGRFKNEREFTKYVYSEYPEFTVKSELIKREKIINKKTGFCTIGYQGKDIDAFLNVLIKNNINLVLDVRRNPFSMNFAFIKSKLRDYLSSVDVGYIHMPELGVKSEDRKNLNTKEDYEELFMGYRKDLLNKKEYIDKIIELGKTHRVALLCFENDVRFCHRREIARYLRRNNYEVTDL